MCGINGIIYFNSFCSQKPFSFFDNNIQKMNDEVSHRGPDSEGKLIEYPVCLGFRRLSIIDLSDEANQPMFNEDKSIAIIFNGEIYNYTELIPELKSRGHIFKTKSDTEVIIHSYEEYGFDCVNKFNGMWAFAIYDFRKKIFFASRDRFGVKPFYYFLDEKNFIFSSEIKAILKINNIKEANHGKVFDYLTYGYRTNNGETFFKGINELKPAHNIIIQNDKIDIRRYWNFNITDIKETEIKDRLNYLLYDSVRLRFRSDVPVSILLSGGLDSAIITKISDELIASGDIKNEYVTAFSAVFPGFEYDESDLIEEFLKKCNHIKSVKITPGSDDLLNSIHKFVYGMGEPVFSATSFAHYTLMKEIKKQNVKVVLNGQGSDEAWCGYDKYILGYFLLGHLLSNPGKFFTEMNSFSEQKKYSYKYILQQVLKALLSRRRASYLRSKYQEKIYDTLSNDFIRNNKRYLDNPSYKRFSKNSLVNYLKYNIQYQGFNQILHYEDHSSMQNSIEMRSPFIDYRLMEFAFSIPVKHKLDNAVTKKILRELFKDKIPGSIINNPKKIGFVTPFDNWMDNGKIKSLTDDLINSESFNNKSIFNSKKIKDIFNNKNKFTQFPYWRVINLELWSQIYEIDNL